MSDDVIGMEDMEAVFSVTDSFGISRERVSVPLEKVDPGSLSAGKGGILEIVVPRTRPMQEFAEELWNKLEELGFQPVD